MNETNKYASTNYIHDGIIMTEYENEPFVVGDYDNNQVEFLHLSHERWYIANPYPNTSKNLWNNNRIFGYSPVLGSESSQSFCDSTFYNLLQNAVKNSMLSKIFWSSKLRIISEPITSNQARQSLPSWRML